MTEEQVEHKMELLSKISNQEIEVLEKVLQVVRQVKFGYVQITIQDAQVVQIDKMEKYRLNRKQG